MVLQADSAGLDSGGEGGGETDGVRCILEEGLTDVLVARIWEPRERAELREATGIEKNLKELVSWAQ